MVNKRTDVYVSGGSSPAAENEAAQEHSDPGVSRAEEGGKDSLGDI